MTTQKQTQIQNGNNGIGTKEQTMDPKTAIIPNFKHLQMAMNAALRRADRENDPKTKDAFNTVAGAIQYIIHRLQTLAVDNMSASENADIVFATEEEAMGSKMGVKLSGLPSKLRFSVEKVSDIPSVFVTAEYQLQHNLREQERQAKFEADRKAKADEKTKADNEAAVARQARNQQDAASLVADFADLGITPVVAKPVVRQQQKASDPETKRLESILTMMVQGRATVDNNNRPTALCAEGERFAYTPVKKLGQSVLEYAKGKEATLKRPVTLFEEEQYTVACVFCGKEHSLNETGKNLNNGDVYDLVKFLYVGARNADGSAPHMDRDGKEAMTYGFLCCNDCGHKAVNIAKGLNIPIGKNGTNPNKPWLKLPPYIVSARVGYEKWVGPKADDVPKDNSDGSKGNLVASADAGGVNIKDHRFDHLSPAAYFHDDAQQETPAATATTPSQQNEEGLATSAPFEQPVVSKPAKRQTKDSDSEGRKPKQSLPAIDAEVAAHTLSQPTASAAHDFVAAPANDTRLHAADPQAPSRFNPVLAASLASVKLG